MVLFWCCDLPIINWIGAAAWELGNLIVERDFRDCLILVSWLTNHSPDSGCHASLLVLVQPSMNIPSSLQ